MRKVMQTIAALATLSTMAATEVHSVAELTEAVMSASPGDTIRLMKDGSPYVFTDASAGMGMGGYQSKTPFLLIIDKNLTIEGEDGSSRSTWTDHAEPVVIDGNGVGGFVHAAKDKKVTLRNLTFTGGTVAANYTAPIYSAASSISNPNADVICTNCVFRQNSGSSFSGAFCSVIQDCLVTNNSVCALRGCYIVGCDIVDSAVAPVSLSSAYDSTFRAIRAGQLGMDSGMVVSNCTIEANAFNYYIANAGVFMDCMMMDNTVVNANHINLVGSGMSVQGCTFENHSLGFSRTILPQSYSCTNCTFRGNTCKYVAYNPLNLVDCRFEDNLGEGGGSAVYIDGTVSVKLDGCTFLRNRGDYASGYGGAIYMKRTSSALCSLVATNCVFEGNNANTGGFGGAIYNDDSALPPGEQPWDSCLVQDCTFTTNAAAHAAGVYGVKATGCRFDRNFRHHTDISYHLGNAARRSYLVGCDINEGDLYSCVADRCVIHDVPDKVHNIFREYTRVTNSLIVGCSLADGDGTLYAAPYLAFDAEFVNCTIVSNRMSTYAVPGAEADETNTVSFVNCILNCNSNKFYETDFDVYKPMADMPDMQERIIFSNTYYGKVDKYIDTREGRLDFAKFSAKTNAPSSLAVCENPKFVWQVADAARRYPAEPLWALSYRSPLLGAGAAADWMRDAVDLEGRPRLRDGKVDPGCYQCWLVPPGMSIVVR